ncbi:hypothetical protein Tcan_02196, partial [Toxocara canis]
YQLNCESGEWHHYRQRVFHSRKWLGFVAFTSEGIRVRSRRAPQNGYESATVPHDLFVEAERLAVEAANSKIQVPDGRSVLDEETEKLRWFVMGSEVSEVTSGLKPRFPICPFSPKKYPPVFEEELRQHGSEPVDELLSSQYMVNVSGNVSDGVNEELEPVMVNNYFLLATFLTCLKSAR